MRCFPIFIDLHGTDVIIIGHGRQTEEKIARLAPFCPNIRLFAKDVFSPPASTHVELIRRPFTADDLSPAPAFVLVTDTEEEEASDIYRLCVERGIPVNVADRPALCTFYFPSLISRGALSIGISTNGQSPAAAGLLRQHIENALPDSIEEILDWAQSLRLRLKEEISSPQKRRELIKALTAMAMKLDRPLSEAEVNQVLFQTE